VLSPVIGCQQTSWDPWYEPFPVILLCGGLKIYYNNGCGICDAARTAVKCALNWPGRERSRYNGDGVCQDVCVRYHRILLALHVSVHHGIVEPRKEVVNCK
jgi:hypothetical protein